MPETRYLVDPYLEWAQGEGIPLYEDFGFDLLTGVFVLASAISIPVGSTVNVDPGVVIKFATVAGGVNIQTVGEYADNGPDLISVGAITHSAPIVDIGLDLPDVET